MLYRYILYTTDSFVSRSFPNFWIGTTHIFLRKLFPQFLFVIFCTWVLIWISEVSQERGSGCCILDQIQTPIFCRSILSLKMVEHSAAARQCVQEPTYAKYSAIYVKRPFKPNYVVKKGCIWTLPEWQEKKGQTPFYIPCSHHTLYRFILCFTDSFVCRSFPNFWIGITNIFLRKLFPQFLFTIFCMWVLVQISEVSQERGSGRCMLDQIQTRMFFPEHLVFEDGWAPCGSKMVSTRAHIREVQRYLRKTTLQAELCS
jgi:hypothetical protein